MNKLAASVQLWADPEIIDYLRPADFSPPPKVQSAIIRLSIKKASNSAIVELDANYSKYYKVVNLLFQQPRKTIKNNLRGTGLENHFKKLNLTGQERPQDLDIETINRLSRLIH